MGEISRRGRHSLFIFGSSLSLMVSFQNCSGNLSAANSDEVTKFLASRRVLAAVDPEINNDNEPYYRNPQSGGGTGATSGTPTSGNPTNNQNDGTGSAAGGTSGTSGGTGNPTGGSTGGSAGSSTGTSSDGSSPGSSSGTATGTASVPSGSVPITMICSTDFSNDSGMNLVKAIRLGKTAYIAYYDENDVAHCPQTVDLGSLLSSRTLSLPACPELAGKTVGLNISTDAPVPTPKALMYTGGTRHLNTLLAPKDMPMYSGGGGTASNGGYTTIYDQVRFDLIGTPSFVDHKQTPYQQLEILSPAASAKLQVLYALNSAKASPVAGEFTQADYGNQAHCEGTASPVVIQLPAPGNEPQPLTLSAIENGIYFDILGANNRPAAHQKRQISWLVEGSRTENYFLTLPNARGEVKGIDELFGDNTQGPDGRFAANGFEALRKWDLNMDGMIDRQDAVFGKLRLWADRNADGVTQVDELKSLDALSVRSINLNYDKNYQEVDQYGNAIKFKTVVFTHDGRMHLAFDIWFKLKTAVN